jgi:endonuclease G, mitochondrial
MFVGQIAPMSTTTARSLCNEGYAVGVGRRGEPIWSAEHLTEEGLEQAEAEPGRSTFEPDHRLWPGFRAELDDFRRSGWTRGHLTPSADMPRGSERDETYLLSNVVPQDARLNSGKWDRIEHAVRDLATNDGEIFVVTGPVYGAAPQTIGADHVPIPVAMWKAIYDPAERAGVVIVCENTDEERCHETGRQELQALTRVDPFPGVAIGAVRLESERVNRAATE